MQSGVAEVISAVKPDWVVATILRAFLYEIFDPTFLVSTWPSAVTVKLSEASAGAAVPAAKEIGRNLSSLKSVGPMRSTLKKSPQVTFVQSALPALLVMVVVGEIDIPDVGFTVPGVPESETQT